MATTKKDWYSIKWGNNHVHSENGFWTLSVAKQGAKSISERYKGQEVTLYRSAHSSKGSKELATYLNGVKI